MSQRQGLSHCYCENFCQSFKVRVRRGLDLCSKADLQELTAGEKVRICTSWSIIVHTDVTSFREEYLVCEESCLLSSAGGYIGIFFGISLFDFLFFFEWSVSFIFIKVSRKNKWNEKKEISFDIFTDCIVFIMWRLWSREENYCIFISLYSPV